MSVQEWLLVSVELLFYVTYVSAKYVTVCHWQRFFLHKYWIDTEKTWQVETLKLFCPERQ